MTLDHAGEAIGVLALCMAPAITFTEEQKILFQGMRAELGIAFYGLRERALAEARRKESEDLYKTIFEHSGTLLWLVEPDGTISLANRLSEVLTGYSRSETENLKRWEDFFSDKDVFRMRRYRRARLYSGKRAARQFQARLIAKSGKKRTVLVSPGVVPGTKRMIPSMIDISARKKAEQDVRNLNEYLQAIVDNANVLVVLLDGRGRVRVWNRAAELITGYSASEVVGRGRPWKRLYPYSITDQAARALVNRITAGEAIDDVEASIVTARGDSRLVSWYAKGIVDRNGRLLGIVVLGRDVTTHREMEEKRREAESRAQHAERLAAIGEMAAGVAHEINNPLTGMIGLAQLLAREDLSPLAAEHVQSIVEGGERIARIVDSLLMFAGRRQLKSEPVSLNECVSRAIDSMSDRLELANIHVYCQLDSTNPMVGGDATCLERVFHNLLVNAHDELCETDSVRRLLVRSQLANNLVRIEVQDNGRGIPHSSLARVFQPFYTTKPPGKGTGLGLSICHGLVAEHGGRIFARNNAGAGATLVVELPVLIKT
jgi:PAS domain S-box-containing protein